MPPSQPSDLPAPSHERAINALAAASCVGSISVTMWYPFLPLYMLQLGAKDDAEAVFWVALGLAAQGGARLLGGPLWGLLSDHQGRKKMFVRAMYATVLSSFILGIIQHPWQLCIALALHGLLAGLNPAAIALTSVIVPDGKLKSALSKMVGAMYVGGMLGPAIGAGISIVVGFRGAMFTAAFLVAVMATFAIFQVPDDRSPAARKTARDGTAEALPPFRVTVQFALAVFVYFTLFCMGALRTVAAPMALKQITAADVTSIVGVAFTLTGLASVLGVFLPIERFLKKMPLRATLAWTGALLAGSHFLLGLSTSAWVFVAALAVAALLNASMLPATNTLIAFNTDRERRGTAFGIAGGAQSVGTVAGPFAAAFFAAHSFSIGFAATGVFLAAVATLIALVMREPPRQDGSRR